MPLPIVKSVKIVSIGLIAILFSVPLLLSEVSGAEDNSVSAIICGGNSSGAKLDLTEPSSDTVVNMPTVTLRGSVSHATQIEVSIDGNYETTVPLGDNQLAFAFDVTLSRGTHTIELTANDVCQVKDATDSTVVTYQPVEQPTDGGTTPTEVDTGDGGIVVNPEVSPEELVMQQRVQAQEAGGLAAFTVPLSKFASVVGFDTTFKAGNTVAGVARVALTVTALSTIVLAGALAPVVIQTVPSVATAFNITGPKGYGTIAWILRGGGALLMALAYLV